MSAKVFTGHADIKGVRWFLFFFFLTEIVFVVSYCCSISLYLLNPTASKGGEELMDCLIPFFTSLGLFLMVYFSVFCAVFYCKGHDPTISPGKPFSSLIEFAIRNIFPLFCSRFPILISFTYFYLMVMI